MASSGRDNAGRFANGHPGSKPRNAITNAIRRMMDPEQIATFLLEVAGSDNYSTKERLKAVEMILDRVEGRAIATVALQPAAAPALRNLSALTLEEKLQYRQLELRTLAQTIAGTEPGDPLELTRPGGEEDGTDGSRVVVPGGDVIDVGGGS